MLRGGCAISLLASIHGAHAQVVTAPPESCEGRCSETAQAATGAGCYCDAVCETYEDCCADWADFCQADVVVELGCTDDEACNYSPLATEDSGTCTYVEDVATTVGAATTDLVDCNGCLVQTDCFGVCGGSAVADNCGVCDGDNSACASCSDDTACNYDSDFANAVVVDDTTCVYAEDGFDCYGACLLDVDCEGTCGGTATLDICGLCGGDGTCCYYREELEGRLLSGNPAPDFVGKGPAPSGDEPEFVNPSPDFTEHPIEFFDEEEEFNVPSPDNLDAEYPGPDNDGLVPSPHVTIEPYVPPAPDNDFVPAPEDFVKVPSPSPDLAFAEPSPAPLALSTCLNNCGMGIPNGTINGTRRGCFCDDLCHDFGDCCDDFDFFCAYTEPGPSPDGWDEFDAPAPDFANAPEPAPEVFVPPPAPGVEDVSPAPVVFDIKLPTCVGFCLNPGGGSQGKVCFCDGTCRDFGDCCHDFWDACEGATSTTTIPLFPESCQETTCDGMSSDKACYCDELCKANDDCCDDVDTYCNHDTCFNGLQDGSEEGVDCGGDCDLSCDNCLACEFDCAGNCVTDSSPEVDVCGVCGGDGLSCADCMELGACNYNGLAFASNPALCVYATDTVDCNGNCIAEVDCQGVCGGSTNVDNCGVCGGDDSSCTGCTDETACNYQASEFITIEACEYPTSADYDCFGQCVAELDCCGVCGGDGTTCTCPPTFPPRLTTQQAGVSVTPSSIEGGTCQFHCGERSPAGCYCTLGCEEYGDCCSDYFRVCDTTVPCEPGRYHNTDDRDECLLCPDGQYQPEEGQDSCLDCAVDCDVGYYTMGCGLGDAGECAPCTPTAGFEFTSNGGLDDSCEIVPVVADCPLGQYKGSEDFITYACADCDPLDDGSYYTDEPGFYHVCASEFCAVDCPIGFYNNGCGDLSSGECMACTPVTGTYFIGDGDLSDACPMADCPVESCEVGYYLDGCEGTSAGTCTDCSDPGDAYFTSNGGLTDSCGTQACVDCPLGQYLLGCSGTSAGECVDCTSDDGFYFIESVGLRENACDSESCEEDCDAGFYRAGCEYTSMGSCVECSPAPQGMVYTSDGGLEDACEATSCNADCPVGEYNADCGNVDNLDGTCEECSEPPVGYYFSDDGDFADACGVTPCDTSCGNSQYRAGCGGTNPGECQACTLLGLGQYFVATGGLRDACEVANCVADCPVGEYRKGCEGGDSAGTCEPCTNAPEGSIYSSDGGFADACEFVQCDATCETGEYLSSCTADTETCLGCTNVGSTVCMANGADNGYTFNYASDSSNKEIARRACESEYGEGNCEYGACGGFEYYFKFEDGHCDCEVAVGSVEWIFSNDLGYVYADQDFRQTASENEDEDVAGDTLFTRVRTVAECSDQKSWEVLNLDLGEASSSEMSAADQTCGNSYYTADGEFSDSCPTELCDTGCPMNQYLSGCSGTSAGECVDCAAIPDGSYYSRSGGMVDACESAVCVDDCPAGFYLSGCGVGPGECVACSAPADGTYLSSNGNMEDACASEACLTACPTGSFMIGECGGPDGSASITCQECLTCGIGFVMVQECDGTTDYDDVVCESPTFEREAAGVNNNFDSAASSVILFGENNTLNGECLFTGSGKLNDVTSHLSDLGNPGGGSAVGGGYYNENKGGFSFVAGGQMNCLGASSSAMMGGHVNEQGCDEALEDPGTNSLIGGGTEHINDGQDTTVGAGLRLKLTDGAEFSSMGGGAQNSAGNDWAVGMGGKLGRAVSNYAVVIGGYRSKSNGRYSTTLGGSRNTANGKYSASGGFQSRASSARSLVLGFDSTKYCRSIGTNSINVCTKDGFYVNDMELSEIVADANARRALQEASAPQEISQLMERATAQDAMILLKQAQLQELRAQLARLRGSRQRMR